MVAARRLRKALPAVVAGVVLIPGTAVASVLASRNAHDAMAYSRPAEASRERDLGPLLGRHDALPRGVPEGYSWRYGAEDPIPLRELTGEYHALNVWGQVFAPEGGVGNDKVRVAVRNPRILFRTPAGWREGAIPSGTPGELQGAYWRGDYSPDASLDTQPTSEGDGSWSVPLSSLAQDYDVFHFWWSGMYPRTSIPADAEGVIVYQEMRLMPTDPRGTVVGARFLASSGADLFRTPATTIHEQGWNPGINQPRFRWLTPDWQVFAASTLTPSELAAFPPP